MKKYKDEKEGQRDFYESYLTLINNDLAMEDVLSDNTDGIINGNLLEFKTNINDLNAVLFQAIKYQSAFRIKGKSIPANMLLISLNDKKAYLYKSDDYLSDIEKVYQGERGMAGALKEPIQSVLRKNLVAEIKKIVG